jgi:tetratricopeptide (TPR) repeat protein
LHPTEGGLVISVAPYALNNLISIGLLLGRQQEAEGYLKDLKPAAAGYYGGLCKFLVRDFEGSNEAFSAVIRTKDAVLRSSAYGARASLLAELGRVREALTVLEEGIASDAATGNVTGRGRKLLASAHLHFLGGEKVRARALALEATRFDGDTECLRRAASLLARAGFPADARTVFGRMNAPDEGRRFETARTIVTAEIALAEGHLKEALAGFAKADQLAAPIHPRDFLGRSLERAGRIEEALGAWRRIADRPALVWVSQPDLHAPGLWTEALLHVTELALRAGQPDAGRAALTLFLKIREHADADLPQSAVARQLLKQFE